MNETDRITAKILPFPNNAVSTISNEGSPKAYINGNANNVVVNANIKIKLFFLFVTKYTPFLLFVKMIVFRTCWQNECRLLYSNRARLMKNLFLVIRFH